MATEEQITPEDSRSKVGLAVGGIAVVAQLLFIFQNTEKQKVEWLWFDFDMPLFLLIFITIGLTLIVSVLAAWVLNRRKKKS